MTGLNVLTPCRIESGDRKLECRLATVADEMIDALGKELSLKGIVLRRLEKAYLSVAEACCAYPVRWLAVCAILLQRVCRKTGSWRYQLVALRVGKKLLELRYLLLQFCVLCEQRMTLAEKFEVRRLQLKKLRLMIADGCFDLCILREFEDALGCGKQLSEDIGRECGCGCDGHWIHDKTPFACNAEILA